MGRIFRRMGLPFWTFVGIGVSAIWFNYLGALLEEAYACLLGPLYAGADWLPKLLVFVTPFALLLGLLAWQRGRYQLRGVHERAPFSQPEGKRGLIVLVSCAEHALHAIAHHHQQGNLQHVWLIWTGDEEQERFGPGSRARAQTIKAKCEKLCGDGVQVELLQEVSPADAQDTFEAVNRIYRLSGLEPREIIADFTGGTKPMTVGMIMACLRADRELEYISYNPQTQCMHGPYLVDYQHTAFNLLG